MPRDDADGGGGGEPSVLALSLSDRLRRRKGPRARPRLRSRLAALALFAAIVIVGPIVTLARDSSTMVGSTRAPNSEAASERPREAGWHSLPTAPITGRAQHAAVWTGEEMIIAGGVRRLDGSGPDGGTRAEAGRQVPYHEVRDREAAAFAPATWRWRRLPDLPVAPFHIAGAGWTGAEALFVATQEVGRTANGSVGEAILLAFSPSENRWRSERLPGEAELTYGLASVWTGEELLLWGYEYHAPDKRPLALRYHAGRREWREYSPGPLPFRELPVAAWTGTEMIVFGGDDDTVAGHPGGADGAAFNPSAGTWRRLAPSPLAEIREPTAAWSGRELIVWGGSSAAANPTRGAAYDPSADSWRVMPDAPITGRNGAIAVWTGQAVAIVGGSSTYADEGRPPHDAGVYDPKADTWTRLEVPAKIPCRGAGVWTGQELLLWGGDDCELLTSDAPGLVFVPPRSG